VFWVILVYFNLRNILPKSGIFPPGHPAYTEKFQYIMKYLLTPNFHDWRMSTATSAILTYVFQCSPLTYTHTNAHTHARTHTIHAKMADEEDQQVENAFDILVSITENSGNLRKDLKQDIL